MRKSKKPLKQTPKKCLHKLLLRLPLKYLQSVGRLRKKKIDPKVPRSFAKACHFKGWSDAIDREYNALVKRGTWPYVKQALDMKLIPYTWVFKQNPLDAEGKKFIEKARCCLRGDRQMIFVDYEPMDVYAPVASHDSIRMLISLSAAAG